MDPQDVSSMPTPLYVDSAFFSGVQPLAAIAQPLGRFSLTGSMAVGRSGHTATALPMGRC